MNHTTETPCGLMSRIKQLLSDQPGKAHTIAGITEALDMWGIAHKAEVSACMAKLLKAGKVTRTTVPATSTLGRREIAAYQHANT